MIDYGQYSANIAQLIEDEVSFMVPANNYDVKNDERLLIPFIKNNKIGFVNQRAEPVVEPRYDIVLDNVFNEQDLMRVGIINTYGFPRANGNVQTYKNYKYGVLDSKGNIVFDCEFLDIYLSDDNKLFTLRNNHYHYGVVNRRGNIIIPFGDYTYIDSYTLGYARVKVNNKWGIVDMDGKVVLPMQYDQIWAFHTKKNPESTKVIKGQHAFQFNLKTGRLNRPDAYPPSQIEDRHYGEFAGSYAQDVMGYSDDVINDAFEGDPDNYWNID